jgi:hypothetical protein
MMMKESGINIEKNDSLSDDSFSPPPNAPSTMTTVRALFLKTVTLQSRSWCSNLCQVLSPVLCLLFTLAVRQIVGGITTGAVWSIDYPQPINLPVIDSVIRPQLGLACQQLYYY